MKKERRAVFWEALFKIWEAANFDGHSVGSSKLTGC